MGRIRQFAFRMAASVAAFALLLQFLSVASDAQDGRQLTRESLAGNEARTALVIGNGKYQNVSTLENPVNDATDMAETLRGLGFEVITGTDANLVQMRRLIREFGEKLEAKKGIGLVFYAGHGVEVRGKNFLIPVDADISREVETEDYAIDVNSILRQMDAAGNGFNIVILDACRNNPFSRGWSRSADSGGLANVTAPTGTYIAYAAAPGTTASDGKGTRNGVFTGALLKNLRKPNLKLEEVFKSTREEVMTVTSNKQVPWDSSSIKGDFYFQRSAAPTSVANIPTVAPASAAAQEAEAWDLVKESKDPGDLRLFLKEFPNGTNSATARIRLDGLVWESAKRSNDKALVEAYLGEFPNGANSAAARIKLRQIEAAASVSTKETPVTKQETVAPGTIRKNASGIELVWIPPGDFMMGSPKGDSDERPVRKVTFAKGFWMGRFEITQGQWRALIGSNPSSFVRCGDDCPVETVNWDDAVAFVAKLNASDTEFTYSLPSEAQWEYAARAGTLGDYYGDAGEIAWTIGNSKASPHPVGKKLANAWGLYDMSGNVWEWCADLYSENGYAGLPSDGSPNLTVGDPKYRVQRGGSWGSFDGKSRSPNRGKEEVSRRYHLNGFRIVAVRK
ncbi:MAG: SUMF1/EgtB/PvdO family nonheme iron enzyme [Acidobacteria bacterium]|nr:SUMF1/EgtB/PvdO family nonheme iron enzyme [Acidobacteriota bacterium]